MRASSLRQSAQRSRGFAAILAVVLVLAGNLFGADNTKPAFEREFWTKPNFFPIAVWLQSPNNAERFKAAGINLYVGLWRGPNDDQLQTLTAAGMPVICAQNRFALARKDDPIIVGWMHDDEPDNAQSLGSGKRYGPPVKPEVIVAEYDKMRAADPSRPILLNLGQGVAWDNYIGRGVRRNRPEDYPEYIKGCDIASFDIYPAVHDHKDIAGKLEYVARGVERLRQWSAGKKVVWNCIECTHIGNPDAKASPRDIRAEVWMSLIHGSRGLIYFVHQFKPSFKEAALLDDPETLAAVTKLNAEVQSLAAVINSPETTREVQVHTSADVPVAFMLREHAGHTYLFAVGMKNNRTRATFNGAALPEKGSLEVIGESRSVPISDFRFEDDFEPYAVHLYRWSAGPK